MTKSELILVGGGGHCKSCIDVLEKNGDFRIAGIVDVPEKLHEKVLGYEIIATDEDLERLVEEYPFFLITIGQIRSPERRIHIFDILKRSGATLPVVISPLAYTSKHASIGEGTILMHHAVVNADAKIGRNCIINTKALIEHDAVIGDHCHIATGAIINGGVKVCRGSFIGSGTVTKQCVEIGPESLISAGKRVMADVR